MSLVEQVTAYFTLGRSSDFFTLGDPLKSQLGNTLYPLIGDSAYDITTDSFSISVRRGRSSRLTDDIPPGVASVTLYNLTRTYDPNYTSSPYAGNVKPGKRITLATNYVTYFDGVVEDWNYAYSVDGMSTATALVVDELGSLARSELNEWTTTSQAAGARIAAVLDRAEVSYGAARDLSTGVNDLQADTVTLNTNVLQYLQLVTRTDLGYLFASRTGLLTFRDRRAITATPSFTIGTDVPFHGIEGQYGSETLFNRISVERDGGTAQVVSDETSRKQYGPRALTLTGLLLDNDDASTDLATYLLAKYKQPIWRVSSVRIKLHALDGYQCQLITGLDIGSTVAVAWTPNGLGSSITSYCTVEGIEHDVRPMEHDVTLHLGDADSLSPFILGSTIFAQLGGIGSLSY